MASNQPLRLLAPLFALALLLAGCDGFSSGRAPSAPAPEDTAPTVSFSTGSIPIVEESSPVEIGVTISNPPADDSVSVEVLYADGASTTSPSDFNLSGDAAAGEGYVVGTVGFSADDTTGTTKTLELNIQDETENEPREDGIFVLQNVQNASIGSTNRLAVTIGALQILFEDFSDGDLAPFSSESVASSNNWQVGNPPVDEAPVADASGFEGDEPSNDWLISPAFNFNVLEDETLSFQNALGFEDTGLEGRGLQVKVSTDYSGTGDPRNATWINVSDQATFAQQSQKEGNFTPFIGSGEVDLSSDQFQSDSTYIAFQYRSSGTGGSTAATWQLNNIVLTSSTPPPEQE